MSTVQTFTTDHTQPYEDVVCAQQT